MVKADKRKTRLARRHNKLVLICMYAFAWLITFASQAIELQPLKEAATANSLIIRVEFPAIISLDKIPTLGVILKDKQNIHKGNTELINVVNNNRQADFEFRLPDTTRLSPESKLEISGLPSGAKAYDVIPVVFRPDDLSRGLDFETAVNCGVWLGNLGGKAEWNKENAFRGIGCMAATWTGNQMVSLIPGERDWTPYAELRFTLSNPLPPPDGTRDRNMFIFDGKNIVRPTTKDSIPQGNLKVLYESSKEFRLDLRKLAQNHPKLNLKNVRALQIFWSSTRTVGATTFYIDNMSLLTEDQLKQEKDAVYIDKFNKMRQYVTKFKQQKPWQDKINDLQSRFDRGERDVLDGTIVSLEEALVNNLILQGSKQDTELRVVVAHSNDKIMRDSPFQFSELPAKISAAGNERESFQLVIAPANALKQVDIVPSDLRDSAGNIIPSASVRVNPVGYVEVSEAFFHLSSRTGFWPDILHENRPFDLQPRIQPFMITVAVPKNQKPGLYHGSLDIRSAGIVIQSAEYQLRVYGFSLPRRGECITLFTMNYIPEDRKLRRKVYDMLFDYRISPVSMYQRINKDPSTPTRMIPDFEDLEYCMEKGINILPFGCILDRPAKDPHVFSEEYIQAVLDWIEKCRPELIKLGAWDISCLIGFDEIMHAPLPIRNKRLQEAVKITSRIKKAYPDCKISNVGRTMDISPGLMDIWFVSPIPHSQFGHLQKAGAKVAFYWVYEDPSFMLDLPGIAPRICAWMAYKENAAGMAYYSTFRPHATGIGNNRPPQNAHPNSTVCIEACIPNPPLSLDWDKSQYNVNGTNKFARPGDGVLLYPAPDRSLLPSFRLTAIRDGIEDYEYLKILHKLSKGKHPLLKIPEGLVNLNSYTRNTDELQKYRDQVAAAIDGIMKKRQ